jgi:hypothetical protein
LHTLSETEVNLFSRNCCSLQLETVAQLRSVSAVGALLSYSGVAEKASHVFNALQAVLEVFVAGAVWYSEAEQVITFMQSTVDSEL